MKEDKSLEVGEDSEKDQLEERLERGKRMKQQQIGSWCVLIYDLQSQRKEASMKGEEGKNKHGFNEGIQTNN